LLSENLKRAFLKLYVNYCFNSIKKKDPRAFEVVKRGVKKKIILCLLRHGNEWMSISEIAREIKVSKATVQDHLEVMLREGVLEDMRIMNRRLFKIKDEVFSPFPPLLDIALVLSSLVFFSLYVFYEREILLGLALGTIFSLILTKVLEKVELA